MAHVLKPRVAETSTTTGTGAFSLSAALDGHQRFSAVLSTSDTTEYMIVADDGSWEEGIGTYSATNTLTRTTITNSSNAGSAVNFAAGSKTVLMTPSAARVSLVNQSASGLTLLDGYTEEVYAVSGTTPALSPTNGSIQTWTLTGNSTPTAGTWADGQSMTLMVDDGTAYTVTWTSLSVTWKTDAGSAPTLNTTGYTAIALWKVGSTIYGARVGDA